MNDEFGKLLRQRRKEAKKSLADVADILQISVPYLSDVERGNRGPLVPEKIAQVANYLNCSLEELLTAAAVSKGHVQFDLSLSERHRRVGYSLLKNWKYLTKLQLEQIELILKPTIENED